MNNKGFMGIGILIAIVAILAVGGVAYYAGTKNNSAPKNTQENNNQLPTNQNSSNSYEAPAPITQILPTITNSNIFTTNWKTFVQTKHGFSFQYPDTWSQWGNESEAICDLHTGATCTTLVDFMDTASQGVEFYDANNNEIGAPKDKLRVEYHFDSKGTTLYQYALSQYGSKPEIYSYRKIEVAGRTAIVTDNDTGNVDSKGRSTIPKHITMVSFLDKNNVGEFQFVFTTPKTNKDTEVPNFEKLLTTFKFN
jgi:hypothetical protein